MICWNDSVGPLSGSGPVGVNFQEGLMIRARNRYELIAYIEWDKSVYMQYYGYIVVGGN